MTHAAQQSPSPYSRLSVALHWLMLVLLIAVYAAILLRESYPRGSDIREALKATHFMLGLSVFVLVAVRIVARRGTPLMPDHPGVLPWLAALTHLALYSFMIVMPLLGWLTLSAEGEPIPFFGLSLPALTGPNEALAEQAEELHQTLGTLGYWLIGLHAAAALFHHYGLRDGTLGRMWPVRR